MTVFEKSMTVLGELFAHSTEFVLATVRGDVPAQRVVRAFYDGGSFWILTHAQSNKVREIERNSHASLCREFHVFSGTAHFMGEEQPADRSWDKGAEPWYFIPSDDRAREMGYLRLDVDRAFFHRDGVGYKVDFAAKTAEEIPFAPKQG